jgi:hypothetical protein
VHAARFVRQPARLPERWQKKDYTANLINFYTQLNIWQLPKRARHTKTLVDQKLLSLKKQL